MLEYSNVHQYFESKRSVPLSKLWRIVYYLWDYQNVIEDEQQYEEFSKRVDDLAGRVVEYIEKQKNTPTEIRKAIKKTLVLRGRTKSCKRQNTTTTDNVIFSQKQKKYRE